MRDDFNKECPWCEEDTMARKPDGMVKCSNGCGFTDYINSNKVKGIKVSKEPILQVPVEFFKNLNPTAAEAMVDILLGNKSN